MKNKSRLSFVILPLLLSVVSWLNAQQLPLQQTKNDNGEGREPLWVVPLSQPASNVVGQTETARRPLPREDSKSKTKQKRGGEAQKDEAVQPQPAKLVCGSGGSYNPANFIQIFENTTAGKQ